MNIKNCIHYYNEGYLTKGELFGALIRVLSENPKLLNEAKISLDFDASLRAGFEEWLESSKNGATMFSSNGIAFKASPALIDALTHKHIGDYVWWVVILFLYALLFSVIFYQNNLFDFGL